MLSIFGKHIKPKVISDLNEDLNLESRRLWEIYFAQGLNVINIYAKVGLVTWFGSGQFHSTPTQQRSNSAKDTKRKVDGAHDPDVKRTEIRKI